MVLFYYASGFAKAKSYGSGSATLDQSRKDSSEDPNLGSASGFTVNIRGLSFLESRVGPLSQQLLN